MTWLAAIALAAQLTAGQPVPMPAPPAWAPMQVYLLEDPVTDERLALVAPEGRYAVVATPGERWGDDGLFYSCAHVQAYMAATIVSVDYEPAGVWVTTALDPDPVAYCRLEVKARVSDAPCHMDDVGVCDVRAELRD